MDNVVMSDGFHESIFQKVIPILEDYMLCKLKIQQMKMRGKYDPNIECRIKEKLAKHKQEIEQIIIE